MPKDKVSQVFRSFSARTQSLALTPYGQEWLVIGLFCLLSLVMLFPLSVNPLRMLPEPSDDPLLNVWRMQWNARAFLTGPAGVAALFEANIFYPFPLTLAYSEHFLMQSGLALPLLLIVDSHLFGLNISVLVTFILSGYGMYLLISTWTGHRGLGVAAGLLFAFSPHRFGQLNHLELLTTQWMPLALLALHWTLTRPGWRYPLLFAIFFNLQALSGFHFTLNLTVACVLLAALYTLTRRVEWRRGLWLAGAGSVLATLLVNWPIWRVYLRFSDVMGAVRTPGEVRIYSAALTDYLTTIPHNYLYGWTFGYWPAEGHQFQPLMPVGLVGLFLAVTGLLALFLLRRPDRSSSKQAISEPPEKQAVSGQMKRTISETDSGRRAAPNYALHPPPYLLPTILFLLLLTLVGFILSFGLNEEALGPALAPLLSLSPYRWLYDHVAVFQGIRVPGRYGILVVLGLVGLAGWGLAAVNRLARRISPRTGGLLGMALVLIILVEYWSVPLVGPEFPTGGRIPPVYTWLRRETPAETVVLELPFQGNSEFIYEYYASYHWRRLANGGTGFTPPIYKDMRRWFTQFPDPRSVDVIQQLGIDRVILHQAAYEPADWQQVLADLPLYWPHIDRVDQVGEALVLAVAAPFCRTDPAIIRPTFSPASLDGLANAAAVTYHNPGPAAFVADVEQVSRLLFETEVPPKNFTEPLVTPAGETQTVIVPLPGDRQPADLSAAWLATLGRTVAVDQKTTPGPAGSGQEGRTVAVDQTTPGPAGSGQEQPGPWRPLGLRFAAGPRLTAYSLSPETPTACGLLTLATRWQGGQAGDTLAAQLLDPFGRVVFEETARPWTGDQTEESLDARSIPLPGSLPAGRYGLRLRVYAPDGRERPPVTEAGVTIPADQIPPLPVTIHPQPAPLADAAAAPKAVFNETVSLLEARLPQETAAAGAWLRFGLLWQIDQPLETDLTVFTQLLGPEGRVWGQRDNQPQGGRYATSLWPPHTPVADEYAFQIQPDAPPGLYRLVAGLYHTDSLERLTTRADEDFVELGQVVIE